MSGYPKAPWRLGILLFLAVAAFHALPCGSRPSKADVGPPPGPPDAAAAAEKRSLHLPQTRQVNFTLNITDGAGYTWDIQNCLNIGQGTNYVYSGGVYCQIQGSNVYAPSNTGWTNAAGDEIEIGPWQRNNVTIYRRCKIYREKGEGLARWLDIFENSTNAPVQVPVQIYTCTNASVGKVTSSTGGNTFGDKDFAFITDHQEGRPKLLHVVCDAKSKVRPVVQVNGNTIYNRYTVTVPAGGKAVLCYFESQGNTADELDKRMKSFKASRYLKDLSPAVRKLIINFRAGDELEGIDLDRQGTADVVMLKNGDRILGQIKTEKFTLQTLLGSLDLPAKEVVGFAGMKDQDDLVRAVLLGGQIVTGRLAEEALELDLPTGGQLRIGFNRIAECSYRVSKDKPEDSPMTDPLILLRNGDRLAFQAGLLKCTLRTRHGSIDLKSDELLEVRLDHESHGVHRANFLNGSRLAGLLGPEQISLPLKLGKELNVPRDMVLAIRYAAESKDEEDLGRILLSNDDELFGQVMDEELVLATDFGPAPIKPANVLAMAFDPEDPTRAAVTLWDGSTLRGRLRQQTVRFQIKPGPALNLHLGQIVSLRCPSALPPATVVAKVERYVAMLGAASYNDRKEAQEELVRMGKVIAPLLKKYLKDTDPEVRQRVTAVLEQLGGISGAPAGNPPMVIQEMGGMWQWQQGGQGFIVCGQ